MSFSEQQNDLINRFVEAATKDSLIISAMYERLENRQRQQRFVNDMRNEPDSVKRIITFYAELFSGGKSANAWAEKKVNVIKALREATGIGLREAKHVVDFPELYTQLY